MNETTTKAVLNESTLTAIAEAIRQKSSSSAAMKPGEMPEAIKNIKSGGGDGYIYMINGTNSDDWPDELIYDGGNTKKSPRKGAFYHNQYISPTITLKNAGSVVPEECFKNIGSLDRLQTVNWPEAKSVQSNAFDGCQSLVEFNSGSVTHISATAFRNCKALKNIGGFESIVKTYQSVFMNCISLEEAILTNIETMVSGCFYGCTGLKKVDIGEKITAIDGNTFYNCSSLEALIIRKTTLCKLSSTTAFNGSLVNSGRGYIYVPKALLTEYQAATNWVRFKNQFRSIEDYPDVCG